MIPVLIPLRHLDGFDVWIGNDHAGACWRDRTGYRWHVRWAPPARFIFGTTASFAECVTCIVNNYR